MDYQKSTKTKSMRKFYRSCMGLFFKTTLLLSFVFLFVCTAMFFRSCDVVIPQEYELDRYPELHIFIPGRISFKGIAHNLDTGYYTFSFKTCLHSTEFFSAVCKSADVQGWQIYEISPTHKVFIRPSEAYPAADHLEKVTLKYTEQDSTVSFTTERMYNRSISPVKLWGCFMN